ncbi:hypothetical protein ACFORG_16600 [Lutimaribacter marinistellae]|uniref:Uncharacterized protein n=1 Tax=Lutimaribacter marinistellae TaxID=1820329 RepID=A0ABV7TJK4_9RHOB
MRQDLAGFDERAHQAVETAMLDCLGKAQSKDLQKAPNLVRQIECLVPHRRRGGADLARFHADDMKALVRKPLEQMLNHGASFKPDPRYQVSEALLALDDLIDITGQFTFKSNTTLRIHNSQCARPQRNIQSAKILHRLSPLFIDTL